MVRKGREKGRGVPSAGKRFGKKKKGGGNLDRDSSPTKEWRRGVVERHVHVLEITIKERRERR